MKLIVSPDERDTQGLLGRLFGKGSAAALLLAVLLIGGTAWAMQPDEYTIFGAGSQSCGSWTAEKEKGTDTPLLSIYHTPLLSIYHAWITGYLTAYSRWVEKGPGPVGKFGIPGIPGAWAWIDNYCQENPLEGVAMAAEQLIFAIEAK